MKMYESELRMLKKCILSVALKLEQYEVKIERGQDIDYDAYCRLVDKHDALCQVLSDNVYITSYKMVLPMYVESLN